MSYILIVLLVVCFVSVGICILLFNMRRNLAEQKKELETEIDALKNHIEFNEKKAEIMQEVFNGAEEKKQAIHRGNARNRFDSSVDVLRNGKNGTKS